MSSNSVIYSEFAFIWTGFSTIVYGLFASGSLLYIHSRNVYQDLMTVERKSVSNRKQKPTITSNYRMVAIFTELSILFGVLLQIVSGFMIVPNFSDYSYEVSTCGWMAVGSFWFLQLQRLFLYLVYIIRLRIIFGQSAYGYSKCSLVYLAGSSVTITFFLMGIELPFFTADGAVTVTDDGVCMMGEGGIAFATLGVWTLYDLLMNIVTFILFMVPLCNVVKGIQSTRNLHTQKRLSEKMTYFAAKVAILTWVAALTTILTAIIFLIFGISLSGVDLWYNCYCLALMTPYYDDNKYFKKHFALCICCCDCGGYVRTKELSDIEQREIEESKLTEVQQSSTEHDIKYDEQAKDDTGYQSPSPGHPSVDTASAARVGANQLTTVFKSVAIDYSSNYSDNQQPSLGTEFAIVNAQSPTSEHIPNQQTAFKKGISKDEIELAVQMKQLK